MADDKNDPTAAVRASQQAHRTPEPLARFENRIVRRNYALNKAGTYRRVALLDRIQSGIRKGDILLFWLFRTAARSQRRLQAQTFGDSSRPALVTVRSAAGGGQKRGRSFFPSPPSAARISP